MNESFYLDAEAETASPLGQVGQVTFDCYLYTEASSQLKVLHFVNNNCVKIYPSSPEDPLPLFEWQVYSRIVKFETTHSSSAATGLTAEQIQSSSFDRRVLKTTCSILASYQVRVTCSISFLELIPFASILMQDHSSLALLHLILSVSFRDHWCHRLLSKTWSHHRPHEPSFHLVAPSNCPRCRHVHPTLDRMNHPCNWLTWRSFGKRGHWLPKFPMWKVLLVFPHRLIHNVLLVDVALPDLEPLEPHRFEDSWLRQFTALD